MNAQQVLTAVEELGDDLFGKFILNKRMEWDAYRTHVSNYEINLYLPLL